LKRAQISGQIFIFIMGILIAGLVLLFGIRFVVNQLDNQDKIMYSQFVNRVSENIDVTGFGTVDNQDYKLPSKYVAVCFADYAVDPSTFEAAFEESACSGYPFILDEIKIRPSGANVMEEIKEKNNDLFLLDDKGVLSSESVGKVKISYPYCNCVRLDNGYVNLQFEGVSGGVSVTEWQE
jgi:hypothetical protein